MEASWQFWAILSAIFAALTAIFAKVGLKTIDADFATFLRTILILFILVLFLTLSGQWKNASQSFDNISWVSYLFLVLSALTTGASWLTYFRALQIGDASRVAPLDKLSVVFVALFGVVFLGEKLGMLNWLGIVLITAGILLLTVKL